MNRAASNRPSRGPRARRWCAARYRQRCPRCGRGELFCGDMTMYQACPACGAVYWQHAGEWMGPVVMDYSVAAGGALVTWNIMVLLSASQFFQIIVPALAAAAGGAVVIPWSRSFWTLFLCVNGEMGLAPQTTKAARLKPLAKKVLALGRRDRPESNDRRE